MAGVAVSGGGEDAATAVGSESAVTEAEEAAAETAVAGWAGLPWLVVEELVWLVGEKDRRALAGTCRSWRAAEERAWAGLRHLAPRRWLPRYLRRPPGPLHSLAALTEQLDKVGKLGRSRKLETLDLSVGRDAEPPRLLSLETAAVEGLARGLWLRGLRRLGLRDVVFGDAELAALAAAAPRVEELSLSLGLYLHGGSPSLDKLPFSAEDKLAVLSAFPLEAQLIRGLHDLDVLLLLATRPFRNLAHLRLDHHYLNN